MEHSITKKGFYFFSIVLLTSIIYSKFLLSVGMIGLIGIAILNQRGKLKWIVSRPYWFIILIFAITFLGIVNSDNYVGWFHHVKMKLPFLVMPIAFYNLPKVNSKVYRGLHFFFAIMVTLSAIPSMLHYTLNYEEVQIAFGKGQPLHTPVHHVKYSLYMAFSAITLLILYREKWVLKFSWERNLQVLLILLSIIVLHVMAVRTGIVVFYLTLITLALIYAVRSHKWKVLWASLVVAICLPVLAFNTIPSLYKRVHYMAYDYKKYLQGKGDQYSDANRIQSWKVGWEIFLENPIIGTGIGDFKDSCGDKYQEKYGPEKYVLYPHNQYLFYLASAGLLGLVFFMIGFGYPFFHLGIKSYLFLLLGIICTFTFLLDNVIERSFGVGFVVFFLCLGITHLSEKDKTGGIPHKKV